MVASTRTDYIRYRKYYCVNMGREMIERQAESECVSAAMQNINRAWLEKRPQDLTPLLQPDIVFVFPGFVGRLQGREALVASFVDFCTNAIVHEYRETDQQVDVIGDTAVVSFRYEMVYERGAKRSRASGRDVWVFTHEGDQWIAVWRTMLEVEEQAV